ncbi:MAG: hypothetical protein ACE5G1_10650 [bacterium]
MKKITYIAKLILSLLFLAGGAFAQIPQEFWIKTFDPGSSDLTDSQIDQAALAMLDSLMQDQQIEVTFLGAADEVAWKIGGKYVHKDLSETWNDAKRLSRARALRARYGRGHVGVTHENVVGVKVIWTKKTPDSYFTKLDEIKEQNTSLEHEIERIKTDLQDLSHKPGMNGTDGKNGHESDSNLDVNLQAGFWTWQSGSSGSILSPYLAASLVIGNAAFMMQGGVTPWHSSSQNGNKSESFIYAGARYMKSQSLGFSLGVYRGWEFFTDTDNWLFKTTGVAAGVVINKGLFELNPALTYSNLNYLTQDSSWRLGITLGVGLNVRNILRNN